MATVFERALSVRLPKDPPTLWQRGVRLLLDAIFVFVAIGTASSVRRFHAARPVALWVTIEAVVFVVWWVLTSLVFLAAIQDRNSALVRRADQILKWVSIAAFTAFLVSSFFLFR
jgi:hypothetical protein